MSTLELKELPELPDDKAEKIKRNWWIYLLFPLLAVATHIVDVYIDKQEQKPCLDMNIYLLKKLDSTDRENMLYMREIINEPKK